MTTTITSTSEVEITARAKTLTVINDGQSRYAVETAAMQAWIEKHGKITDQNYNDFCDAVPAVGTGPDRHLDSIAYGELLEKLVEAGAQYVCV